ncbi:MAG: glutamyl-tRNA reductase [Proteobacteria bacterium]|nr:glutamyl-tRNA reductase [Pseudomonadota bacterium]MBU4469147.1 glutamyl-tRNA reductase [Pseudomonadota bacterium]MCG2752179.1 glutamyl-tRNA reductase [Desulfobacteraceae bacterium]
MHDILIIGLNHKTAPVEIRECIAFSGEEAASGVEKLHKLHPVQEAMLISTCNRVEVLVTTDHSKETLSAVTAFLAEFKQIPMESFKDSLYVHAGDDAVRHIFRVAGSLDSMILGEPQILGQIKEAYRLSIAAKTSGVILNRLLHKTFSVAKRIRTETGIGDHAVSISFMAVELGRKIFSSLEGKAVLLIGAGEMAELAVEHLIRHKIGKLVVANRTLERGMELAKKFKGESVKFEEIPDCLETADIVVSSTGSKDYVLFADQVKKIMRNRKNKPIFFIDIAVPRDIDPEINKINNAYVYDIDDLKNVIQENLEDRKKEAVKAERIVDEAAIHFRKWLENLSVVPTIIELRNKIQTIARDELKKTAQSLNHLSDEDLTALDKMINAMTNKILHDPTMLLKSTESHWNKEAYLDLIHKLFNLYPR